MYLKKALSIIHDGIKGKDLNWGIGIRIEYNDFLNMLNALNLKYPKKLEDDIIDFLVNPQIIIREKKNYESGYMICIETYPAYSLKLERGNVHIDLHTVIEILKYLKKNNITFYDVKNVNYIL